MATATELDIATVAEGTTALDLAHAIFGAGVEVVSASYSGSSASAGIYSGASTSIPGISPTDSGVILSTGNVGTFTNSGGGTNTNVAANSGSDVAGVDGDSQLNELAGEKTFDGAILEASFIPDGDYLTMQFVFSSEEYLEYVKMGYNDVVGVWVNGEFVPLSITEGGGIASVNTINTQSNPNLYVDNPASADTYNTEMDGFTKVLSLKVKVEPGQLNTIRIGIADAGDAAYDSNLLIMGESVQTLALAMDDQVTLKPDSSRTFDILANDRDLTDSGLTITKVNGIDIAPGGSVTLVTGEKITLNPDGTVTVYSDGDIGSNTINYTIVDGQGNADVSFLTITTAATVAPDGVVEGTSGADLIDAAYDGDPDYDMVDAGDALGVEGTTGDGDVILAGAGDDTVLAGAGDDIVYAGSGADQVSGGAGDDRVSLGEGDDLFGLGGDEAGNDTIEGDAGNDTIYAGSGDDIVSGGTGADQIYGGAGNDSLFGGAGTDTIIGGEGNDTLDGGEGDDLLRGEDGDDALFGRGGADTLYGGAGNDLLDTGSGANFASGEDGDDTLIGGDDADTLYGGAGADRIDGGAGGDLIYGGGAPGATAGTVIYASTGSGYLIRIEGADTGSATTTTVGPMGLVMGDIGMNVDGTLYGVSMGSGLYQIDTTTGVATQVGSLASAGFTNSLSFDSNGMGYTGGGSSSIYTFDPANPSGAAVWWTNPNGGAPAGDFIFIGDKAYVAWSDGLYQLDLDGSNAVVGSSYLGTLPQAAYGLTAGADGTLYVLGAGGEGNGLYRLDLSAATGGGEVPASFVAGSSSAAGSYWGATSEVEAGLSTTVDGADLITAGDGDDTVHGGAGDDTIYGGAGSDLINGDQGHDYLAGGDGDDTVHGGSGDDYIEGNDGDDSLSGGDGDDTIYADAGNDLIDGGAGNDSLGGGTGDDTIHGGDGDDIIGGDDGDDLIDGGAGDDTLMGGAGNDTIYGGAGDDIIHGGDGSGSAAYGGVGNDTIHVRSSHDAPLGSDGGAFFGGDGDDTFTVEAGTGMGIHIDGDEDADNGDIDTLDLTGAGPLRVVYDEDNPEKGTVEFLDSNGNVVGSLTFSNIEKVVPCFTPGTWIATDRGEVPVEGLVEGDMVLTRDDGFQPLLWAGRRDLTAAELAADPHFSPVRIAQGALGHGLPLRDMLVSPQHRILIGGPRAEVLFGEREVLVPALHLVGLPGIDRALLPVVSYIHLLFDRHQIVSSDGAWTESFQPGQLSLGSMDSDQRAEVLALFPELVRGDVSAYPAARLSLKAHEVRVLLGA